MKYLLLLTLALVGCGPPSPVIELPRDSWTCTKQAIISVKPFLQQCVEYRKLQ